MAEADRTEWDAIIIGSGIGGMAAAAALSKLGHKVLLLEQYQTLGGLTHSFSMEGFSWDAGIHYLNCVAPDDRERDILNWLSDTPIAFTSMGAVYDNLHIGDTPPLALSRPYEAQERDLKDRFPDEVEAIEAWIAALREGRQASFTVTSTRAMPEIIGSAMKWWHGHAIKRWCVRTTQEVIDEITDSPDLAAAIVASCLQEQRAGVPGFHFFRVVWTGPTSTSKSSTRTPSSGSSGSTWSRTHEARHPQARDH